MMKNAELTAEQQRLLDAARESLQKHGTVVPPRVTNEQETNLILDAARESLKKYGTLTPPRETLYSVMQATCTRCNHTGPLVADFGLKTVKGEMQPQSWCRRCRNSNASHPTRSSQRKTKKKVS